jgi:excisionase family DNA binding protein
MTRRREVLGREFLNDMSALQFQKWTRNEIHRSAINSFVARKHDNPSKPLTIAEQVERTEGAVTADKLAKLLGVSKITIFKMAKSGRIPSFRVGTCVRFDPRQVADWLRKM